MQNKQIENAVNEVKKKYSGRRGRYDMVGSEWTELARMAVTDALGATAMTFDYGFMKGVRFAKAMMKKGYGEKGRA